MLLKIKARKHSCNFSNSKSMGNHESSHKTKPSNQNSKINRPTQPVSKNEPPRFVAIKDHYESIPQLQEALRKLFF